MATDIIGYLKVVEWENAKGRLRAVAALSGSYPNTDGQGDRWDEIRKRIEDFIQGFEADGLDEP